MYKCVNVSGCFEYIHSFSPFVSDATVVLSSFICEYIDKNHIAILPKRYIYRQMLTILADKMGCFNQIATEKYILYENQKTAFVWRYLEPKILSPCELQLTMWMSSQRHFHVEKVSIKLQLILLEHAYRCVK